MTLSFTDVWEVDRNSGTCCYNTGCPLELLKTGRTVTPTLMATAWGKKTLSCVCVLQTIFPRSPLKSCSLSSCCLHLASYSHTTYLLGWGEKITLSEIRLSGFWGTSKDKQSWSSVQESGDNDSGYHNTVVHSFRFWFMFQKANISRYVNSSYACKRCKINSTELQVKGALLKMGLHQ